MAQYLTKLGMSVLTQLIALFGFFFIFSFIQNFLQTKTQALYRRSVGWKGILWTAWIGTPVHELSHAFFAKLFRHKIDKISLFRPNELTGNLGSVNHSYDPNSLYQKIGNFFIGAAPLIAGPCVVVVLMYILAPNTRDILYPFGMSINNPSDAVTAFINIFKYLFAPNNISHWQFWLFIYLTFAVVTHMAPSREDQKNLARGFFWIAMALILLNACALLLRIDITRYVLNINKHLILLSSLFTFSIIISLAHLLLCWIILSPFRKL